MRDAATSESHSSIDANIVEDEHPEDEIDGEVAVEDVICETMLPNSGSVRNSSILGSTVLSVDISLDGFQKCFTTREVMPKLYYSHTAGFLIINI